MASWGCRVVVVPTLIVTSFRSRCVKPLFSMEISYFPGERYRKRKCPRSSDCWVSDSPVDTLRAVMTAEGTAKSLASRTSPSNRPFADEDWAHAGPTPTNNPETSTRRIKCQYLQKPLVIALSYFEIATDGG